MMIVDAQVHIWETDPPSGDWHRKEPYPMERALAEMDAAGVGRALLHPGTPDEAAQQLAIEAARAHPDRFAVMGWFPLDRPNPRALAEVMRQPGMLGLRFMLNQLIEQGWPDRNGLEWLWPEAERIGVPLSVRATTHLPEVGKIAERHPGLKLLIDHMAVPRGEKGEHAYRFQPLLLALAKYPNVAVKATAQPGFADDDYPYRSIHGHLHRVFDAFGPERMFWGTDITRVPCTWRQCVTLFTEELPWLKGRDLELVMGRALCDWLGWRLPD